MTPIATLSLGIASCGGGPKLEWNPPLYKGDHRTYSVVRQKEGRVEQVYCGLPEFSQMHCTWTEELAKGQKAAQDLYNKCERWREE